MSDPTEEWKQTLTREAAEAIMAMMEARKALDLDLLDHSRIFHREFPNLPHDWTMTKEMADHMIEVYRRAAREGVAP